LVETALESGSISQFAWAAAMLPLTPDEAIEVRRSNAGCLFKLSSPRCYAGMHLAVSDRDAARLTRLSD
jgi:hypothetical protein